MDTLKRRLSAPSNTPRASSTDHGADADLAKMGYSSSLPRNLSMLSVLGMSFAIMAVPFGLSTTLYITLTDGQSVTILWGWVLISLISLSIAASLAEICAVYPTAGGVYYWSAMMSTREWAPIASWKDLRLAEPSRQLDRNAQHKLLRRATSPLRHLSLA
ncbi:hypothetical protein LTR95_019015 [Oleoguttula sp. CCFEE 5521]